MSSTEMGQECRRVLQPKNRYREIGGEEREERALYCATEPLSRTDAITFQECVHVLKGEL